MKNFLKGPFNGNGTSATVKQAQLQLQLLQAFYRREHDTIEALIKQKAPFNAEMLDVAVGMRDAHLTFLCLDNGLRATEDHMKSAVDAKDAHLLKLLAAGMLISDSFRKYVHARNNEKLNEAIGAPANHAERKPEQPSFFAS